LKIKITYRISTSPMACAHIYININKNLYLYIKTNIKIHNSQNKMKTLIIIGATLLVIGMIFMINNPVTPK